MLVLQAVAVVILVPEATEELRERSVDSVRLFLEPRRRTEVRAALARIDRLHLLDADDGLQVVATGLDLR